MLWKIKKKKKKSGENKNKLRKMYPDNPEDFKNSNPRGQFYWLLQKKERTVIFIILNISVYGFRK